MVSINMLLSIITLNYKTPERTLVCINSVQNQFKKEFTSDKIEHIIVDNDSHDGSLEKLKKETKHYKNVRIIANKENVGFGRGCNSGANYAKGQYLLFLNSDTIVENREFLKMIEFLEHHQRVAIMGGQMTNMDGTPQLSAWKFYTLGNLILLLLGAERFGLLKKSTTHIQKVDWVTGGCMMVKKTIFEQLGKFDPHIFMYIEDMELCFRAKKEGFDTYMYPHVKVLHASQGSSNRSFAIVNIYKGIRYFYAKHMPVWQYRIADILLTTKAKLLVIIGRITGNSYLSQTYEKTFNIS